MYKINPDKLEFGDIILIKSDDDLSRRVRHESNSQFSHAMLYVGLSTYIDSTFDGVQANNIQRFLFENTEDVRILRLKDEKLKKKLNTITNFARQKIGTEYSLREALESVKGEKKLADHPNRQFCTRFISQAYYSAQIELTENINYPVPEDLIKSDLLIEIPNISRKATSAEVEYAESESPLKSQKNIHNNIFKSIRKISGQDIQTFDQLKSLIIEHPEFDEQITKIVEESGYLTMMDKDFEKNSQHYDSKKFIIYYKSDEEIINAASKILNIEIPMNNGIIETIMSLKEISIKYDRNYFKMEMELYEKLKSYSDMRLKTATAIWNKYVSKDFGQGFNNLQF
jgi:hypothetical protein